MENIIISHNSKIIDIILHDCKMARFKNQETDAIEMLKEFINELREHQYQNKQKTKIQDQHNKNVVLSFLVRRIEEIDSLLTAQINEILHHPDFQKLEGSWRGFHYLVTNTETGQNLKIKLLNVTLDELRMDLTNAIDFDQSDLFKKVYEEEYGTFGGIPYSCLLGDYYFNNQPQDIALLELISGVAAAAHTPFISSVSPSFFNLDKFEDLPYPRDLTKLFESPDYIKWNSFRNSEDSRYVAFVLPRILMRLPYGDNTCPVYEFNFQEEVGISDTKKFCWGNAAYAIGQRITNSFAIYGWTAAIRGVENGGVLEGLPSYTFVTTEGDKEIKCPTEVAITDRREKEISELGFICACYCKGTDYAVLFSSQTTQKVKVYDTEEANANASLSARLTYILAASRFAHYIKVIMRDKIGSFFSKENVETYLNNWLSGYVLLNDDASSEIKAKYPLREGRIDVYDVPGSPGKYKSVIYLRPHFQMEELTVSIRLVATLPERMG